MKENAAKTRPDGMPVGVPFTAENQPEGRGRPKGSVSPKAELQKLLTIVLKGEVNPLTDLPEDMPAGRKVALNLLLKAVADNDLNAIKQVFENIDGKPAQAVSIAGTDGGPIETVTTINLNFVKPTER